MTVHTIARRSDEPFDDEDSVSPMHNHTDTRIALERPQAAHFGMGTPALRREGIAALDYFSFQGMNYDQIEHNTDRDKSKSLQDCRVKASRKKTSFAAWCRG